MINKRIDLARAAAGVTRFHTARIIHDETVGEHSFNVCNLLLIMTNGEVSRNLLIAALIHDMGEPAVGDVPSPVKKRMPKDVREELDRLENDAVLEIHPYAPLLSQAEAAALKLADNLDGLLKCRDELRLGNRGVREIGDRYVSYIHELTDKWEQYRVFAEHCIYLYRKEI
jgi:5'-deoxynucleotidase YfbR-like HD superfamily hydrolase